MGLLTRTHPAIERRFTLRNPTDWFLDWFNGGTESLSGERVSPSSALSLTAYFAAIRAISEDVAKLPFKVGRKVGRATEILNDHPLRELFNLSANECTSSMAFRETMTSHALGWGNGYAEILRGRDGVVTELICLDPAQVTPFRTDRGVVAYRFRGPTKERILSAADVLHVHGLGFDGIIGYSLATIARESIGLGLAAQSFAGAFYGNGLHSSGIVKTPKLKDENARQNFMKSLEGKTGVRKAGRLFHVEGESVEFIPLSIPAKDAQFLEMRQFQVREMARLCRIPPHKIGDLADATFSNIAEQSIEYVVDTLGGWFIRWEQEVERKLLTPQERGTGVFVKHVVAGLLRGDIQSRFKAYAVGRQWGWLSPNDVRELEDLNPLPGDQGNTYLVPSNMISADQVGKKPDPPPTPPPPAPDDDDGDEKEGDDARRNVDGVIASFGPTLTATFDRLMRAAAEKVERHRKREDFNEWLGSFGEAYKVNVAESLEPTVRSMLSAAWSALRGGELPTDFALAVRPLSDQMATNHAKRWRFMPIGPGCNWAEHAADNVVEIMIRMARTLGK